MQATFSARVGVAALALGALSIFLPDIAAAAGKARQPWICTRSCWGARSPSASISQMSSLSRAIVHHTAGNEFNTTGLEDSKADVRAIQNLHMDTNGWSDIGYHFLVDKFGHTFEGRYGSMGSLPKGAHDGTNTNSFGFNVMGYFHPNVNNIPTAAMMHALYDVIAWRMPSGWQPYGSPGKYGPLGNYVGYVDSHRRVKSTACPGDHVHNPYIGNDVNTGIIRAEIKQRIDGVYGRQTDFNGDGRDDASTFQRGTTADAYVTLSSGGGFGAGAVWHDFFCAGTEIPGSGDFNGDGKADAITFTRGDTADVFVGLSNGSAFNAAKWHDFFAAGNEVPLTGDFNGDGKDDIITFLRGTVGDVYVSLSNGSGFGGGTLWHTNFCYGSEVPLVGDFNGDGKSDIVTFVRGSSGDVYVALSNGSGFGAGVLWHDFFCAGTEVPAVGDFNGDRIDDIVTFYRGGGNASPGVVDGNVWVALSNGGGFGGGVLWQEFFCIGEELPGVGDFNNDNKDDIICYNRGTLGDIFVGLSNGSAFGGAKWHDNFCLGEELPQPATLLLQP